MGMTIETLNKALWFVIGFFALLFGLSYFQTEKLPTPKEILRPLYQQPNQQPVQAAPFLKKYDNKEYMIRPRYEYDLYGLVVSYKNLDEKWFNIYYKDDPYNIKDLCVIWGGNLVREDYKQVKFWNGTWTCHFQWSQANVHFNGNELSNNHLLPDNEDISKTLKKARTGDQIHFKGYLVDYSVIGSGGGERKSSTIRSDTGNHACEVVYVKEFEILKNNNAGWRFLNTMSLGLIVLSFLMKLYIFFI